jgi:hypothetical protein
MYFDPSAPYNDAYELWSSYVALWIVIVCIYDWTPQLALLYHKLWLSGNFRKKTFRDKLAYIYDKERMTVIFLGLNVLNLLIYGAHKFISTYHAVLYWSDYWCLSVSIVTYTTLAIQVILRHLATIYMAKSYNAKSGTLSVPKQKPEPIMMSTHMAETQMAETRMSATRPNFSGIGSSRD